jgi:hypothetical protein
MIFQKNNYFCSQHLLKILTLAFDLKWEKY